MIEYEIVKSVDGGELLKATNADGVITWIPIDEANSDYQRYLRWLENPDAEAEHLNGIVDVQAATE